MLLKAQAERLRLVWPVSEAESAQWEAGLGERTTWTLAFSVDASRANAELASLVRRSVRHGGAVLPASYVWQPEDAQAAAAEVGLTVALPTPLRIGRKETSSRGTSRYVSGTKTVENPEYYDRQRQCSRARNDQAECLEAQAADAQQARRCQAVVQQAQREYQGCLEAQQADVYYGRLARPCFAQMVNCSTAVRQCNPGYARHVCERFAGTPQTVEEPVYSIHRYPIRKVRQTGTVPFAVTVRANRATLRQSRAVAEVSEEDEQVDAAPAYNVEGDPLVLSDEATVRKGLADKVVAQVQSDLRDARRRQCDGLVKEAQELLRRGKAAGALDVVHVARTAPCGLPDELREEADRLLVGTLQSY